MESDDDLLFMGDPATTVREPRSKRRRMVDASGFEDIARELEEDMLHPDVRSEAEGDDTQSEEAPDAWLLRQYGTSEGEDLGEAEGEGTSEPGDEGMDVDLEEVENAAVKGRVAIPKEEPVQEKATYTSSGRLLVPSHKSREARAVAGAMAAAWEEMEMEMEVGVEKKKPSGSKVCFDLEWVESVLMRLEQEQAGTKSIYDKQCRWGASATTFESSWNFELEIWLVQVQKSSGRVKQVCSDRIGSCSKSQRV